jgi:hypothetical protein
LSVGLGLEATGPARDLLKLINISLSNGEGLPRHL